MGRFAGVLASVAWWSSTSSVCEEVFTRTESRDEDTMLFAEARVETERSSRYLVQLCRHVSKIARAQMPARVEWSDDRGVISLDWGRCALRADPGLLTLRAEARDEESLRRLEQRIADRLERFGQAERLTVNWTPPQGSVEHSSETAAMHEARPGEEDAHG